MWRINVSNGLNRPHLRAGTIVGYLTAFCSLVFALYSHIENHNIKMRFLCLHGRGTNSDIFEAQLGKFLPLGCRILCSIYVSGPE